MSEETIDYRKLAEALAEALEQRNLWIEGDEYRELVILRMRLSNKVESLAEELEAANARIAELEAAQRDLREYIDELEAEKECEMRVFKDGDAWCFVLPDFQDLQVSPSVWMKKGVLDKIYKELRSVRDE